MFAPNSRYASVPNGVYTDPSGREIPYKLLRSFPEGALVQQVHTVADGDRLDLLAFRYYGDPEQYWRICDANRALRPDDLAVEPGRRLTIPLPVR
jgi:nucleoid-associated protein YgaU